MFTSLRSLRQRTGAMVRHSPALSAGGKLACGHEKSQNLIFVAAMASPDGPIAAGL